jgi:hypothetical protein
MTYAITGIRRHFARYLATVADGEGRVAGEVEFGPEDLLRGAVVGARVFQALRVILGEPLGDEAWASRVAELLDGPRAAQTAAEAAARARSEAAAPRKLVDALNSADANAERLRTATDDWNRRRRSE